jgi:hypothetical protein
MVVQVRPGVAGGPVRRVRPTLRSPVRAVDCVLLVLSRLVRALARGVPNGYLLAGHDGDHPAPAASPRCRAATKPGHRPAIVEISRLVPAFNPAIT